MIKYLLCLVLGFTTITAGTIAQTAGAASSKSATDYYDDGVKLKGDKDYSAALTAFKKAIAAKASYKEALYEAGWCSNELEKYEDALGFLKRAKQLWPDAAKIYFEIGYANQKLNKYEDARISYEKCLELDKEYNLVHKYLGNLYYSQSDYTKALASYTTFENNESDIDDDNFYYKKGYCENESEKYNDAVRSLEKSVTLKADEASTYDELGYAYYKLENSSEALKNYNKSIEYNSRSNVPYLGLGDIYKDLKKDPDEALKNYLKALEYKSESKKGQYCVGWCYNEKAKYSEAIPYLKKAVAIDGKYVTALTELGYSYYALKQYNNALAEFSKAIVANKSATLPYYYSGLCYVEQKNKVDALRMYEELKKLGSKNTDKLKEKIDAM